MVGVISATDHISYSVDKSDAAATARDAAQLTSKLAHDQILVIGILLGA